MNTTLLLDRDGAIATLTLNRPASLNALDPEMIEALIEHSAALAADDSVRCVVLRGAGRHFMAGGDIRSFNDKLNNAPDERRHEFTRMVEHMHVAIENLQRMPHPVLASVHGAVAGFGLSLMCACDLAIAADSSYFTSAYRHLGLTPDGGASYTLPRLVGLKKAMEIVLLGERFDASEALRLGLVNRVVGESELQTVTHSVAMALATGPALALRNGKRLINGSLSQSLSAQLLAEAQSFGACAASDDFAEGVRAFLDKRTPRFDDR
ncbi:MAG: enoyl-CoA hydratase [Pseudomonadota bacterium]|nr:enoyl-CoA hydratase [Pseudomonadota bacterium]